MTENELHEYVAEIEGHGSQVTGVVGYFYEMYRREVIARVDRRAQPRHPRGRLRRRHDVRRHQHHARSRWTCRCGACSSRATRASRRSAATAITCRLPTRSFSVVLLIAMLEHTSEPWRVLAEARRVLKPGGRAIIVVPNDVTMSAGRLVLGKFPIRYPDHLTFTTPGRMHTLAVERLPRRRGVPAAVPAAAVRGQSLLLHGRGGGVMMRGENRRS